MSVRDALVDVLERTGFQCFAPLEKKSCFDIAAKRDSTLILFKVLSNIDSLRESQARELSAVASSLCATPLVVGEKSKTYQLDDGIVYDRYGMQVVTVETISQFLSQQFPQKKFFKGRIVAEIESQLLQKKMDEMSIGVSELASKLGVSREAIYKYQKGMNIEFSKAKHLEEILNTSLIKGQQLLSEAKPCEPEKLPPYLQKMCEIGFEVVPVHRGFDAIAKERESLMVDSEKSAAYARTKAKFLKGASSFFETHPIYVLEKSQTPDSIKGIPVIRKDELEKAESAGEVIDLAKKRRKAK